MSRRLFAILPAAGRSVRMGQPKLLLPWRDRTVAEYVVGNWRASRVSQVVMVVHPDDHELAAIGNRLGAKVVTPASPPPDMKASICHALQHIEQNFAPSPSDGWLLAPSDMPGLTTAVIDWFIGQLSIDSNDSTLSDARIVVPTFGGKRGHPVYFPWPLASKARQLAPDEGLNSLVARHTVREVAGNAPGLLEDLDHPDDYRKLHDRYHRYAPPSDTQRTE